MRESSKFIIVYISIHCNVYKHWNLLSFAAERRPNEPELGRAHHFLGVLSSLHEIKVFLDPTVVLPLIIIVIVASIHGAALTKTVRLDNASSSNKQDCRTPGLYINIVITMLT